MTAYFSLQGNEKIPNIQRNTFEGSYGPSQFNNLKNIGLFSYIRCNKCSHTHLAASVVAIFDVNYVTWTWSQRQTNYCNIKTSLVLTDATVE